MVERLQRSEGARDVESGPGGAAPEAAEAAQASTARRGQADDVAGQRPRVSGDLDSSSFERWVQSALNAIGEAYQMPAGLAVDGKLSGPTRAAVRGFQARSEEIAGERLAVDGVAGRQTTAALAQATSSNAPTIREAARRAPQAAPAAAEGQAGGAAPGPANGSGSGGAGPSGGGQTQAAPGGAGGQAQAAPGGQAQAGGGAADANARGQAETTPGEPEQRPEEAERAAQAEQQQSAAAPGEVRSGPAGLADEIRANFAGGVLVSMTIPDAYANHDAVIAEAGQTANGHRGLDGYAYDVHRRAWADGHQSDVNRLWTPVRAALGAKAAQLPESYSAASAPQKERILAALKGSSSKNELKDLMWAAMPVPIAKTVVTNNRYIPNSAQGYATQQRAAAGDSGALQLGKAMIFNKATTDIPGKVTATSAAVAATLRAHAPAGGAAADQDQKDAKASRVRFLTISSHGAPGWMGGHGAASDSAFRNRDVPTIVSGMANVLAPDVRLRLFACHTARTMTNDENQGTIADLFREELHAAGKTEGAVIGHTESGDTQRNSTTRFLHTSSKDAKADWRGNQVFTEAWIRQYLTSLGVTNATNKQVSKLRTAMRDFFGRECWMEDISDMARLTETSRARWRMRHPERRHIDRYIGGGRS